MEIEAEISERYLPVIRKGDSVTVSFPTYPGFEIKTTISRTGNIINTGNRTFKINVKFSNKDSKIKPNMLAELLLSDYQGESISIPSAVIKTDIYGNYVYVINDDQGNKTAEKRYVKTGLHSRENTIIEDGLKPGDAVITAGFNLVENGSHVQIVN
jgi:RND family efflux transporter MFP subunit